MSIWGWMLAAVQAGAVAALGWVVADAALARAPAEVAARLGLPERALGALAGFVALAVGLMVLHIVSGGLLFGVPGPVPAVGAVLLVLRRASLRPRNVPWRRLALAAAILGTLFVLPALIGGSGVRTGDSAWHMGWTEQLLAGEPVPVGPAPEFGRNGYPWGFHAVLATMVRLVPGSDPLIAHEALHVLIVVAIPLTAACLARRALVEAGWPAAAAAALIGGFGWVLARAPGFVASPTQARYGADMMVASPNSVYELFPPAFPRELGLVLLGAAGVLLAVAVGASAIWPGLLAGVVLGTAGLVSTPMLLAGLLWALAATALFGGGRARLLLSALLPAVAVFGLWLGPVASDYLRFGGFVDVSPKLGVEWPLPTALSSWGLLLPLAAAGGVLVARRGGRESAPLLAFAGAALALLLLAAARASFEWRLGGNETLLHQGRAWPVAHLLGAAFAGVALSAGFTSMARRSRRLAVVGLSSLLALGAASLPLASLGLASVARRGAHGFVYGREDYSTDSFVRRAARRLDPDDVLSVDAPTRALSNALAFHVFEFSGVRLARYDDPRLEGNDLRIRFAELAEAWNARMRRGGFDVDFRIALVRSQRGVLESGAYRGERWALVRERERGRPSGP